MAPEKSKAQYRREELGLPPNVDAAADSHRIAVADLGPSSIVSEQSGVTMMTEEANAVFADTTDSAPLKSMSKWRLYARRFFRNRMAVLGLFIFLFMVLLSIFGGYFSKWDYIEPDFLNLATGPSAEHWFGTTDSGNDLYAQTVHGLGRSLTIAVTVSLAVICLACIIGAGAALYGGRVEKITLTIIHFLLAIPSFLLVALIVSDSGGDWRVLIVVMILFGWIYPSRVIWSLSLSIRENDYVRAAEYMGVSRFRTIIRHVVPNIGSLLVISFTMGVVSTVLGETALSFLGLGVKLPDVSLGTLLFAGSGAIQSSPWQFWFPASILTLLTVSAAFISDGLRDALDPNSKSGGRA